MKHLKTYETKSQNLVPNYYIIFTSNSGWLEDIYYMLGQIVDVDNDNNWIKVNIIDNIPLHSVFISDEEDKIAVIDNFKSVFVSPSLEETKTEFEKLEKELVIKRDAKKYNL